MPGVALGMRRLSIIDLATGQQPIHNEDSTVWVVFNGEIYNYAELRAELTARGHRFYTSSDTETIVHAYEEWGQDAFSRLRGMFGIALWDARDGSLLLARDRVGIKPLHYAVAGERLYFASEIKSILASWRHQPRDRLRRARSLPLVSLYAARRDRSSPAFRSCRPGTCFAGTPARIRITRYWELPAQKNGSRESEEEADREPAPGAARRGSLASDERGPARRVSVRWRGFERGRRPDVRSLESAGANVFDRLRRSSIRRTRARAGRRAPLRHRSSRVRGQAGRAGDHRRPDRAFRRTVRRLFSDSNVVRLGDGTAARDRRALRRRRRRAVRRVRPLFAASANCRVRSVGAAGEPDGRVARLAAAAARRDRQELSSSRRTRRARPLSRSDRLLPARRETGAAQRRRSPRDWELPTPKRGSGVTSSASTVCRGTRR